MEKRLRKLNKVVANFSLRLLYRFKPLPAIRHGTAIVLFLLFTFHLSLFTPSAEARFLFFGRKKTTHEKKFDEKKKKLRSKKPLERGRSAEDIIRFDREKGVDEVIRALNREENKEAKKQMLNALGNSKNKKAIPEIKKFLNSEDEDIRLYSACSLARLGDVSGIEELKKTALNIKEKRGRRSMAIRALGNIKSDEAVAVLEQVLDDDDFAIRLQAVSSLGKIGTERAIQLVEGMLSDKNERVRKAAENALKRAGK